MGETTTFVCEECGYESAPVRWGVSVENPRHRAMPAHCMKCRAYVEIDLTGGDVLIDTFHCPQCDSEVFFIEKADSYACPVCGKPGVKLRQGASYW